ncbi:MAG: hypothetical protein HQL73_14145, partial [Magnetococcales bacterium]|nr:hypothetical protein [Magnetococcales bacterium]
MTTLARVIRNTPTRGLQAYFDGRGYFTGRERKNSAAARPATFLLREVEELADGEQSAILADFERIQEMTDESGQWAILHAMADRSLLEERSNPYERAMWLFLNDPEAFRRAEEMRYTDTRRQGRMWSGFVGPPNLAPSREVEDHRRFEERVRIMFGSRNARLDLFERNRPGRNSRVERVVQAVIYRDGLPDASLEFNVAGELELRPRRPVFELAITYEPESGVIEVVAQGVEHRARLARLFAE